MSSSITPEIKWDVDEADKNLKAWVSVDGGDTWDVIPWWPQPGSQRLFIDSCVYETLYEGNRGNGKTDSLLMSFAWHTGPAQTLPDGRQLGGWGAEWRGILFRQTFPQLKDIVAKTRKWFPRLYPGIKFNAAEYVWTWPTGETLRLAYIQRPSDYWNYHGHEYPWIGFEELTTWPDDECYTSMFSCSRSSQVGMPRMIRATTNPYGPGHNWVKMRFQLPIAPSTVLKVTEEEGQPARCAIHGSLLENKILLHAAPDYIRNLRASAGGNEAKLRAWIHGDWDIVAGGMFDDVWDPSVHVVKPFGVPHTWSVYRAFDWGSSSPFSVGWWAVSDGSDFRDGDGRLRSSVRDDMYRISEWYGWDGNPNKGLGMLAVDIARGIIERELTLGVHRVVRPGPADSSIFAAENGVSIGADMMRPQRVCGERRRISFVRSDKRPGSRVTGWELMRKMLSDAKPKKDGTPRERPGLFVFDRCEQFRRTVPTLPRDERNLDDVDTDVEDHVADEARYMVRFLGHRVSTGYTTGGAF